MPEVPGAISTASRPAALRALAAERHDLVIIGGGISAAGIARAAALLGLRVAVLEAHDYAAGTSSRSTKLIHGGLRYLALGDIALVRETARERKEVHARAPHLAEPRWMVLPSRSRLDRLKYRVGVSLYEYLGAVASGDRHQNWSRVELEHEEPAFAAQRHPFACVYREYLTEDARLVLANLRSAAAAGAQIVNYARVHALLLEGDRAAGVRVRTESGDELEVRARCVLNAAGPWVEDVRRLESPELAKGWLHLSKGVHVTLPAARLPVRNLFMLEVPDGRLIFVIPRGSLVYIGTTDTTVPGTPELWPSVDLADVQYLLAPLTRYFDIEPVRPEEVVSAWAGLRPLIADVGTRDPTEISRRDEVLIGPRGVVSIAGGKLTGYRPMARAALARVGEVLGRPLGDPEDAAPLPGGDFTGDLASLERELTRTHSLPPLVSARLVRLYGSESSRVLERGAELLPGVADAVIGEIDWAVEIEGALHLEDVVYRRTRLGLYASPSDALLAVAADRMGKRLGWSTEQIELERDRVRQRLAHDLAFRA